MDSAGMFIKMEKKKPCSSSQDPEVRKGPWTVEEDVILMNYIAKHGEGVWDSLAKAAGLKRTGKSCRLRWLNYLRPDVRRGNITPEEQLLIMELHATWGNKWSKIAKQLPGRTDNEIKNFWRTKVQKHAHVKELDQSACAPHASQEAVDSQATTSQVSIDQVGHNQLVEPYNAALPSYQDYPSSDQTPNLPDPLNEVDTAWWTDEDFWCMQLFNGD